MCPVKMILYEQILWMFCYLGSKIRASVSNNHDTKAIQYNEKSSEHLKTKMLEDASFKTFKNDMESFFSTLGICFPCSLELSIYLREKIIPVLGKIIDDNSIPIYTAISKWQKKKLGNRPVDSFFYANVKNFHFHSLLPILGVLRNSLVFTENLNFFVEGDTLMNLVDIFILLMNFCEANLGNDMFEQDIEKFIRSVLFCIHEKRQKQDTPSRLSAKSSFEINFLFEEFLKHPNSEKSILLRYNIDSERKKYIVFCLKDGKIGFFSSGNPLCSPEHIASLPPDMCFEHIQTNNMDLNTLTIKYFCMNVHNSSYLLKQIYLYSQDTVHGKHKNLYLIVNTVFENSELQDPHIQELFKNCGKNNASILLVYEFDPDSLIHATALEQIINWVQQNAPLVKNLFSMILYS